MFRKWIFILIYLVLELWSLYFIIKNTMKHQLNQVSFSLSSQYLGCEKIKAKFQIIKQGLK